MVAINSVILGGNLTRDPELRQVKENQVASFGIAVNEKYKTKDGDTREKVCFVDVEAWGKVGANCAEYLGKGASVLVEGKLCFDSWEGQDGQKKSRHKIQASRVHFISSKGKSKGEDSPETGSPSTPPPSGDVPF